VSVTLQIDDVAPGGMGVAHAMLEGETRAVFVPRVARGDEVRATVDLSVRPARGRALEILAPGEGRVAPPCAHVDECGACDWMHLSAAAQASAREDHVRRALPPTFRDRPVVVHDAPQALRYRTRARLHARASGGRAIVGFHGQGTSSVVEVDTCLALDEALDRAIPLIGRVLEGAHGTGEVHLALGAGGKPVIELRWDGRVPPALFRRVEEAVANGTLGGASLYVGDVTRPAVIGDPTIEMTGADGAPLRLAPGGFGQASAACNVLLGRRVIELAGEATGHAQARVLELYAGAGNFTVLLAKTFAHVVAVESSQAGCERARENLLLRGLRARVTCADADAFAVPAKTDLVVLDPPRAGARAACTAIAASPVKAIVYVSCNPPTLGRDLAILAGRFDTFAIESFAMFPGTSHSETVVAMRRVRQRGA
jgi:23S rRNA (uracil1939-C5)-methyltransferase